MITLYSGIPGSGKSYKMVAELTRVKDKYFVVHNIDNLKEGYLGEFGVNFLEYCKAENLEVVEFLSREFQEKYTKAIHEKYKRPVLVIIDEAHEWFSTHSKSLKMWLSYHRHLDQDIWLVAHRSTNLPAIYRSFIEVEFRAKSGAFLGVPMYFIYNRILGGQRAGYVKERKKQEIFDLYKSQLIESGKKRKKPMVLQIIIGVCVVGVLSFFLLPQYCMKKQVKLPDKKDNAVSAVPSSGSVTAAAAAAVKSNQVAPDVIYKPSTVLESNLEDKYAYAGEMDNRVILEDRKTGEQKYVEKMPGNLKVVEVRRSDSCFLVSAVGRFYTFYNADRFKPAEKPERQQSAGFSADVFASNSPSVPSSSR